MAVLPQEMRVISFVSEHLFKLSLCPVAEFVVTNCEAAVFLVNLGQLGVFVSK